MSNTSTDLTRHGKKLRWLACAAVLAGACFGCEDFEPPAGAAAPSALRDAAAASRQGEPQDAAEPAPAAALDASVGGSPAVGGLAVASRSYVIVPNPRAHELVVIAATTRSAEHLPCAHTPSVVAAAESADLALALDQERRVGCALDLSTATPRSTQVPIVAHANRVVLSPDSRHAVVFHDRAMAKRAGEPSFDTVDVSVVRLATPARGATVLVGLHPRDVAFSTDGTVAFVVSDAGISSLPLSAAASGELAHAPAMTWQGGPFPAEATVRLSADGARALAFEPDGPALYVLDLGNGQSRTIDLVARDVLGTAQLDAGFEPAAARIADAVLDRAGKRAFVALRGEQRVVELPLPEALDPAHAIAVHALPGQPTDRLQLSGGAQDKLLVLSASDARATLWSVAAPHASVRVPLVATAARVSTDAAGLAFVLSHGTSDAAPSGYSVVRVRDGLARSSSFAGNTLTLTLSDQAGVLAVTQKAADSAATSVELVALRTLALAQLPLTGTVVASGLVGQGRYAYVQLDHPDGRLQWLDLTDGTSRATSGFLIAQRVQE